MSRSARREAFARVGETCPAVDRALEIAADAVKQETGRLREALIEALGELEEARDRIDELETEVDQLNERIGSLT